MKGQDKIDIPSTDSLKAELNRVMVKGKYKSVLKSTIYILITVAAIAVLVATLWLPVLQIYGVSMEPTLSSNDIVISVKNIEFKQGDIVAFYFNNRILVKRIIASSGQWIDIDDSGIVYVDREPLYEPYVETPDRGEIDIQMPYQVPEGKVFVLGDHRISSLDSRNSVIGCISKDQVVGRIVFRVWPLNKIGKIV